MLGWLLAKKVCRELGLRPWRLSKSETQASLELETSDALEVAESLNIENAKFKADKNT